MNIVLVSTYSVECGIATYTADLAHALLGGAHNNQVTVLAEIKDRQPLQEIIDRVPVYRLWWRGAHNKTLHGLSAILRAIDSSPQKPDVVHFQHEFGLFPDNAGFLELLYQLQARDIKTAITFHTVQMSPGGIGFFGALPEGQICIVHTYEAAAALNTYGREIRIFVVPHGLTPREAEPTRLHARQILVPGFISENKGHLEIIRGYADYLSNSRGETPGLRLMGLCRDPNFLGRIKSKIAQFCLESRIQLDLGFFSEAEVAVAMDEADFVILGAGKETPYSASGQLAHCIASAKPVLAKNVPIYRSGGDCGVVLYEGGQLGKLIGALCSATLRENLAGKHLDVRMDRDWYTVAQLHEGIYR